MLTTEEMLWGLALPAGVALLVLAALGGQRWAAALGLAGAYVAGHFALDGWPGAKSPGQIETWNAGAVAELMPTTSEAWAIVLAVGAGLVGMLISIQRVSDGAAWLGRLLLVFALLNTVLVSAVETQWDKWQALANAQAVALIVLVIWWSLDELAERATGALMPLVMAMAAGGAWVLLKEGGAPIAARYAAVLGAALVGAFVAGLLRRKMCISRGGIAVVIMVLATIMLCGVYYADVPVWAALVVAGSPLAAWVYETSFLRSARPTTAALLTVLVVMIPLAAAILMVLMRTTPVD